MPLPVRRVAAACATALALTLAAIPAAAQTRADSAAIRRAVLDYVEGFYEGDTTKLVRSVRPEVAKSGFARPAGATAYRPSTMPWPGFMAYANRVRSGQSPTPANAPKTIALLDVLDQTAAAKLTAWWGVDYLLLARFGDRWMVTHVLWQSTPRD